MVGEIVATLIGVMLPFNYLPADGSCLRDTDYYNLSLILYDKSKNEWLYGRCSNSEFKLPDLRNNANITYYIKVK